MSKTIYAMVAGVLLVCTSALAQDYAGVSGSDRVSYVVSKSQKGNTIPVPVADITRLCGDMDGCTVRLGMYNWDNTARVASREALFYYNPQTRVWRSTTPSPTGGNTDSPGQDANNTVEHVVSAFTCYFTDGEYSNSVSTDTVVGFGLLTWANSADCWLTIID